MLFPYLKIVFKYTLNFFRYSEGVPIVFQGHSNSNQNTIITSEGVSTPSDGVRDSIDSGLKIPQGYGGFWFKCTRFCSHFGLSGDPLDNISFLLYGMRPSRGEVLAIFLIFALKFLFFHVLSRTLSYKIEQKLATRQTLCFQKIIDRFK